jgi:alpha/beta superfamily hydrolase
VSGWLAVAPRLGAASPDALVAAGDHRPKLLLVPEHDQFSSPESVRDATAAWKSTTVDTVPMADHFLAGRTAVVAEAAVNFVRSLGER